MFKNFTNIRPLVLLLPMSVFITAAGLSLTAPEILLDTASRINTWILETFYNAFTVSVSLFFITVIWAYTSKLGRVRIGGKDAKPLLSRWNWSAITICTTIATGLLFWGSAEPMFHIYSPGGRDIIPASVEAKEFALTSMFMHWAFSPYAIYTVAGITFALTIHNKKLPSSVGGPVTILLGQPAPKVVTGFLDICILLALILGMAASLGSGALLLSGGVITYLGFGDSSHLLSIIIAMIMVTVLISSLSGLMKGIRILSDINFKFFLLLLAYLFILGPTGEIISQGASASINYMLEFTDRSLTIGVADNPEWAKAWTIFYWANWLAWAPVTTLFLGRIARGYTVRQFIMTNFFIPSLFAMVWMSVLGVFTMETNESLGGLLKTALDTKGPESVVFEAMSTLPGAMFVIPLLLILTFISYVTAADSNTEAIAVLCEKHEEESASNDTETSNTDVFTGKVIRIIWIALLGTTAWVMVSRSGVDGVRMLSNLGGLPGLFVVLILNFSLIKMGRNPQTLD